MADQPATATATSVQDKLRDLRAGMETTARKRPATASEGRKESEFLCTGGQAPRLAFSGDRPVPLEGRRPDLLAMDLILASVSHLDATTPQGKMPSSVEGRVERKQLTFSSLSRVGVLKLYS